MRLIDGDALIERLEADSPDPEGVDEWIRIINEQPTEGKTGKWKLEKFPHKDAWMCSKCGRGQYHDRFNYCPYCGSDMRDEEEE